MAVPYNIFLQMVQRYTHQDMGDKSGWAFFRLKKSRWESIANRSEAFLWSYTRITRIAKGLHISQKNLSCYEKKCG